MYNAIQFMPISIMIGISFSILSSNLYFIINKRNVKSSSMVEEYFGILFIVNSIFYTYCFMVIWMTILTREPGSRDEVRLQVFRIFSDYLMDRIYAIENIIMFIPLGFMLPFINKRFISFYFIAFIGLISSCAIEFIQFITKRGFTELDDVINNVIGILIGYGIYCLFKNGLEFLNNCNSKPKTN